MTRLKTSAGYIFLTAIAANSIAFFSAGWLQAQVSRPGAPPSHSEPRQIADQSGNSATSTPELSAEQIRARFGNQIRQPAWTGPRVVNPSALQNSNSPIVAVLRKQLEMAEMERSQILSTEMRRGSPQSGSPASAAGISRSTKGGTPGIASASLAGARANICPPGNQPLLRTVDGQKSGVVFAPEATYQKMAPVGSNPYFYTIEGCRFGAVPGQVALVGPFNKGRIDLAVDTWTDTGIIVHVPAGISGELDQDNVTLALTISGVPLQASGFKFYAARDEVLLSSVPAREASLGGPRLPPNFPFYQSPGFGTFDVQRTALNSFAPGTDYYSFDGLQRGFAPLAFQASRYAPLTVDQCNYMMSLQGTQISFDGTWNARWENNGLRIDWPLAHCHGMKGTVAYNVWATWYGVQIWVSGPRGVNPWAANWQVAPQILYQGPHGF